MKGEGVRTWRWRGAQPLRDHEGAGRCGRRRSGVVKKAASAPPRARILGLPDAVIRFSGARIFTVEASASLGRNGCVSR